MYRIAVALCAVFAIGPFADAGDVTIGRDTFLGGTKIGTCHATSFFGPADAVKDYQRRQKERFEKVDPETVDQLTKSVLVNARVVTGKQTHCAQNSGVPQKIVITAKGGDDPLLVIELKPEEVKLKNLMGAEFTAVNASATVPVEDIRRLSGKEYDFHLVYADHGYKDKWKQDYAEKILK